MLTATILAIFYIPLFFVLVRGLAVKLMRKGEPSRSATGEIAR